MLHNIGREKSWKSGGETVEGLLIFVFAADDTTLIDRSTHFKKHCDFSGK